MAKKRVANKSGQALNIRVLNPKTKKLESKAFCMGEVFVGDEDDFSPQVQEFVRRKMIKTYDMLPPKTVVKAPKKSE